MENKKLPNRGKIKYLNVGCGSRYCENWFNLDFISDGPEVLSHDLKRGIPFPDNFFDVVYHSHVLEHFTKDDARKLMAECHRVLRPGGTLRIAVPDLEQIVKNYSLFLEQSLTGDRMAEANYDWTMLEMYDQCVRNDGGGEMKKYFRQEHMPNREFVKKRMGYFFEIMTERKAGRPENKLKAAIKMVIPVSLIKKILSNAKNKFIGTEYRRIGKFRMSGEIHQWMYDRFSLARLLANAGFEKVLRRSALDSYIKNWPKYNLDSEPDGTTYKPDSLFMEAKKHE